MGEKKEVISGFLDSMFMVLFIELIIISLILTVSRTNFVLTQKVTALCLIQKGEKKNNKTMNRAASEYAPASLTKSFLERWQF